MASAHIARIYRYHAAITCGLVLDASPHPYPVVVGCSLRTQNGTIIDVPHRLLSSVGKALWEITAPTECLVRDEGTTNRNWAGDVIFAIYPDETFSERLADTGWVAWDTTWMIGASTSGLDMQDEEIRTTYQGRLNPWVTRQGEKVPENPFEPPWMCNGRFD